MGLEPATPVLTASTTVTKSFLFFFQMKFFFAILLIAGLFLTLTNGYAHPFAGFNGFGREGGDEAPAYQAVFSGREGGGGEGGGREG